MYYCTQYVSSRILTSKRLCIFSHFMSVSSYSCVAQYADSSSDDNVAVDYGSYSELQQRMQQHATTGSITKALENLNLMRNIPGRPNVYDYNAMIGCYFKCENAVIDELLEVYIRMKRFGPFPNLLTYNTLLDGLMKVGALKDGILILEEMITSDFYPSCTVLSKLFKKMLNVGNLEDSLLVFDILLKFNYMPSAFHTGVLIQSLCKVGMLQKAYDVFISVMDKGYFCGETGFLFNPILLSLCKSDQIYTALSFFVWLQKKGLVPTVHSYTALVYGFSKEKLWREAFHCLDVMESVDCTPSVITYTVIVKFLCDEGKVDPALKLLEKAEEVGCNPDLVTYNIILRELSHQGRIVEIGDLVKILDQKGLLPDVYTHAALAGGMLKWGEVEVANKLLLDMILKNGCSLDVVVYNIYLHSLCRGYNSRDVFSTMQNMMENGFKPTNVSYNTIIKGLCEENDVDAALMICDRTNWPNTNGPDLISFNIILSNACKQGNSSMIRRILWRLEYEGMKLDVVSATCLLQYYATIGKISECLSLLESMVNKGPRPNTITLNTLLIGLCKNRLLGLAEKIFNYFKGIGISPNTGTYNILIHSSIREGNEFLVYELSREMYSWKVKPDIGTYGCFIYSLCRDGKISLALRLRDQLFDNGISPNIFIYNTLLKAMLRRWMFPEIILLFKDMAMDGCEPNEGSFEILRRAKMNGWMKGFPRGVKILEHVLCDKLYSANKRQSGEEYKVLEFPRN